MQNIEGLPLGTRLSRIARVNSGTYTYAAVLEPDNVYGVLDLTTVKIPEGYKRVEEDWFREPNKLEDYLAVFSGRFAVGELNVGDDAWTDDKRRIILEPIKQTQYVFTVEYIISKETAEALWPYTDAERDRNFTQRRSKPLTTRIQEREV